MNHARREVPPSSPAASSERPIGSRTEQLHAEFIARAQRPDAMVRGRADALLKEWINDDKASFDGLELAVEEWECLIGILEYVQFIQQNKLTPKLPLPPEMKTIVRRAQLLLDRLKKEKSTPSRNATYHLRSGLAIIKRFVGVKHFKAE